jgi:hypothetical protein
VRPRQLRGRRFGRLTVVARARSRRHPGGGCRTYWACRCRCGRMKEIATDKLLNGNTKSCGCFRREVAPGRPLKHGNRRVVKTSRAYRSWRAAKTRCFNGNYDGFQRYGGRGITMCKKWSRSFAAFLADMSKRPRGKTLDRKDNDGNYKPGNCRWATPKQQSENTRRTTRSPARRRRGRSREFCGSAR